MPQFSDDLFLGPVPVDIPHLNPDGTTYAEPSPMAAGIGPLGRLYVFDVVPTTLSTNAILTATPFASAGSVTPNGALLVAGQGFAQVAERFGRCLQMVSSAAGDTTQTITLTGLDSYGQPMSEARTLNGTTPVNFLKAFWRVTAIASSAATAGNLTVGTRDVLGLPIRVNDAGYIVSAQYNNVLARDAGTLVVADGTSPATTTTGDVRGTYALSLAANGARRLVLGIAVTALQAGPNATRAGAYGVNQNLA